jgi:glucokinase
MFLTSVAQRGQFFRIFACMKKAIAIGVDIGGTHITCCAVNILEGVLLQATLSRESYDHEEPAHLIFQRWATALNHTLLQVDEKALLGIGFAIPGPFDYRNGISMMLHKFKHLYNMHIPTCLNTLLMEERDLPMRFLNDATAFAVGEAWQGAGRNHERVVVITLGTGFGSAFLNGGIPVVSGADVPKEGCLWHLPFKNGIADDYFSTRWFVETYKKQTGETISGVKALLDKAENEPFVKSMFEIFGQHLAECMAPWLRQFGAEILVVGGNIVHALPLLKTAYEEHLQKLGVSVPLVASKMMENAALIGSARLMEDSFWEKVSADLPTL